MKKIVIVSFSVFMVCIHCNAFSKPGLKFLEIIPAARPSALADSYSALSDDINAVSFNPGGLGFAYRTQWQATYGLWTGDMSVQSLNYLQPFPFGTFAIGGMYLGGMPMRRIEEGALKDEFSPSSTLLTLSYGRKLTETFSIGLTIKNAKDEIDKGYTATLNLCDIGLLYRTRNEVFSFGYAVQNLGSAFKYTNSQVEEKTPTTQRAGIGFLLNFDEHNSSLGIFLEGANYDGGSPVYSVGIEHWGVNILALRLGYKIYSDEKIIKELDSLSAISAGLGLHLGTVEFDYAFQPLATLGEIHRVSCGMKFGECAPKRNKEISATFKVDPVIFSPNNDNIKDSTFFLPELTEISKIENWAITIYDSSGSPMKTISGQEAFPKIVTWDGKDNYGEILSEGNYTVDFQCSGDCTIAKSDSQNLKIDLTAPYAELSVSTNSISPNNDVIGDTVSISVKVKDLSLIERWQLSITSNKDKIIRTYKSTYTIETSSIQESVMWDGHDDIYNEIAPNGIYKIQFTVFDLAGNKTSLVSDISVYVPPKVEVKEVVKEVIKEVVKEVKPVPPKGLTITLQSDVSFEQGSSELKESAYPALAKVIALLNTYPGNMVLIEGHTDSVGSNEKNLELSSSRAWKVYSYFIKAGISSDRFSVKGYGDIRPIAKNTSKTGQAKNRRVEVIIQPLKPQATEVPAEDQKKQ